MRSTFTARLGRPAMCCLAAAALAAIAGCHDDDTGMKNNTNSPAVMAPGTSTMKDDAGSMGTTQYFPHGTRDGGVLMVEAMGPKTVHLQQPASFQFKVTNLTDTPVHNVMLASTGANNMMTMVETGGVGTTQPTQMQNMAGATVPAAGYAVGDLGPKESKTITLTGTATQVGMVDTCYTVTYNPPTLCTMVQVTNPALALAIDAPADADICKPLQYKYTVTNTGSGVAHNVVLQEDLTDGLMTTDGKSQVMANLGDIPEGQNRTATADLKAPKAGKYTGSAMAKSEGGAMAQSQATATTVHAPVLMVAVTGPDTQYVNTDAKYTITVTNKGDATSMNTKLTVQHSPALSNLVVENVDGSGAVALGDIAPNDTKTVLATGQSAAGGGASVVATADSPCAGEAKAQAMTTFNTIPALLLETVDEHDPVKVGDNVIYDIKVTNQGSGPDNNVAVTATLPDGETYVSTEGPTQPTADGTGMVLTFPVIPQLATKESVTWKVSVKAAKAGDVQFKTNAKCDGTAGAEKVEPTKLIAQ